MSIVARIVPTCSPPKRRAPIDTVRAVNRSPSPELTIASKRACPSPMSSRTDATSVSEPSGVRNTLSRAGCNSATRGIESARPSITNNRERPPRSSCSVTGPSVTTVRTCHPSPVVVGANARSRRAATSVSAASPTTRSITRVGTGPVPRSCTVLPLTAATFCTSPHCWGARRVYAGASTRTCHAPSGGIGVGIVGSPVTARNIEPASPPSEARTMAPSTITASAPPANSVGPSS